MRIGIEFFLHILMCLYLFLLYGPLNAVVYAFSTLSSIFIVIVLFSEIFPNILDFKENPIINWVFDFIILFALMYIAYTTEIVANFLSSFWGIEIENAENFNENIESFPFDVRMDASSSEKLKSITDSLTTPFDLHPSLYVILFYGVTVLVYLILSYLKKRLNKTKGG